MVLIGIPGLKDEYTGRAEELLSDWLGDDAYIPEKIPCFPQNNDKNRY